MTLLQEIKAAQPDWFSAGNKRFFGDVKYYAYRSKKTHKPYLVRATYAWSDMFDQPRTLSFRVNPINPDTLKIEPTFDVIIDSLDKAKNWVFYEVE
jgi:hypothetical protein